MISFRSRIKKTKLYLFAAAAAAATVTINIFALTSISTLASIHALTIQSLSLIDTYQRKNLGPITNTTLLNIKKLGRNLTIQAHLLNNNRNASVVFDLDGVQQSRIDNKAPYTLSGDINGVYFFRSNTLVQLGTHTISATAYRRPNGMGMAGKKYTVQLKTISGTVTTPTKSPIIAPTVFRPPTKRPTRKPSKVPTRSPVKAPMTIRGPTKVPIQTTTKPTSKPLRQPTKGPTKKPSSRAPIRAPTKIPIRTPSKAPIRSPTKRPTQKSLPAPVNAPTKNIPVPNPPTKEPVTTISKRNKCGAAVNTGNTSNATCTRDLWIPTDDKTMHCYAYGGPSDPCSLHNNNDVDDGLMKNPSACTIGDTFYLWDEPDTQGKNYTWAGIEWVKYVARFTNEIQQLRRRGVQFTSPLIRAGGPNVIATHLNTFYTACGPVCHDVNHPAYININAVNAFVGPWNTPGVVGCREAADFITNELRIYNTINVSGQRPWYITNWSRLGTNQVQDQVDAMTVLSQFFVTNSPIQRIYWFGATDYGGNSSNNFLTTQYNTTTSNGISTTTTLGKIWASNCKSLL